MFAAMTATDVLFRPPLDRGDLSPLIFVPGIVLMQPTAAAFSLDRIRRGKRAYAYPPLRPSWWYRVTGWIAAAGAAGFAAIAVFALTLPPDGDDSAALFWTNWALVMLYVVMLADNAAVAFRVARWVDEGALVSAPPLSRP